MIVSSLVDVESDPDRILDGEFTRASTGEVFKDVKQTVIRRCTREEYIAYWVDQGRDKVEVEASIEHNPPFFYQISVD